MTGTLRFSHLLLVLLLILFVSCSKNKSKKTGERESVQKELTSYPDIPDPKDGKGNVAGKIVWNGTGAADLEVTLCQDFNFISGCKGKDYKVNTDKEGYFIFRDVEPNDYSLVVKVFKSERYLYFTSSLGITAKKYTVKKDETSKLGEMSIFKLDLKSVSPKSETVVKESKPELKWEAYPDAAYYKITMYPEKGDAVFSGKKIEDTKYTPEDELQDCKYRLKVEAYSKDDIKIAEINDELKFTVKANHGSCKVEVTLPKNNATVSADGVTIKWEKHPLAKGYQVYCAAEIDGKNENILSFVDVAETEYKFDKPLRPGKYNYSVSCKNDAGRKIADSEMLYFTVK